MQSELHIPVMLDEVLDALRPALGGVYWDLTLGAGGHLSAWLSQAPDSAQGYAVDGDPEAIHRCRHLSAVIAHADLRSLSVAASTWPSPNAVLADFGLSSPQVDTAVRGFSYRLDGPLDMRMDPTQGQPAAEWLEDISQDELAHCLRNYAEVKYPGRIARVIKERLPISTTAELADAVIAAVPGGPRRRAHPARKTFQAIRIAVNHEFEKIESGLSYALERLTIGGRIAAITFHSGEDRVVKQLFRRHSQARGSAFRLVNKKPIAASDDEAQKNPRARSAKLRIIERVTSSSLS